MQRVSFHYADKAPSLKDRIRLKTFIKRVFEMEGCVLGGLSYIFCSDSYLLVINQQYLEHDDYTDIITFDLSSSPKEIVGEVYISIDRVKENAHELSVSFNTELHRVIFHGALHLCGYKDKSIKDASVMRFKEDKYLKLYFS